ncbi:MAG: hypothetical protein IT580_18835, partial [Verrucomicrobiales bacterium]|nr:hypothetical protein [Verrucomicrobiales bacterium]
MRLILVLMAWSLGMGGLGAAESGEPTERQLRAVFREQSFSGVNVAEAKAALGTLIRMLGEGRGYDVEPVILVARDDEEYVRWIREGQFDLTAMDPW